MRALQIFKFFILIYFFFSGNIKSQIFVDINANGNNNGSRWEDAFIDLQDAINVAEDGDEIWVSKGEYNPTKDINGSNTSIARNRVFVLDKSIKIYGGFSGVEMALDERDWESNITNLSGNIGSITDSLDNNYNVFILKNNNENSLLDGFVVSGAQNNRANGTITMGEYTWNQQNGGGIIMINSAIHINNCIIENNFARGHGGGIYMIESSTPQLIQSEFKNNQIKSSTVNGGAIYSINSNPQISHCKFDTNKAFDAGAIALVNITEDIFINECQFLNNRAHEDGGAITIYNQNYLEEISININACLFDGNENTVENAGSTGVISGRGGAIFCSTVDLVVENSEFRNNTIKQRLSGFATGGALMVSNGNLIINRSIFEGNKTIDNQGNFNGTGGAIYSNHINNNFTSIISNSFFLLNKSRGDGAIHILGSQFGNMMHYITNSVFYENYSENTNIISINGTFPINTYSFTNLTFYGNEIENGAVIGIYSISSTNEHSNVYLYNSIFQENTGIEVKFYEEYNQEYFLESHNYFQNEENLVEFIEPSNIYGIDGILGTNDDGLKLDLCSELIDSGINENLLLPNNQTTWGINDKEISNVNRVQGLNVDKGAYENGETSIEISVEFEDVVVNQGTELITFNLDDYFTDFNGEEILYEIITQDPESNLFNVSLTGSYLTINFDILQFGGPEMVELKLTDSCGQNLFHNFNVTVNELLGIDDNNVLEFDIYPNPTKNILYVENEFQTIKKIEIYNEIGLLILIKDNIYSKKSSLDLGNIKKGIYFIKVYDQKQNYNQKKFIKL